MVERLAGGGHGSGQDRGEARHALGTIGSEERSESLGDERHGSLQDCRPPRTTASDRVKNRVENRVENVMAVRCRGSMADPLPELTPDVYDHLHRLAYAIHRERGSGQQTIQPTVLLHEAWVKVAQSSQQFESRPHFMAVAAKAMRQILMDQFRRRASDKRGGGQAVHTTLTGVGERDDAALEVVALDEVLTELEALDPLGAKVVLYRAFGGMTVPEIAEVLEVSESSVKRAWRFARVLIADRLDLPG